MFGDIHINTAADLTYTYGLILVGVFIAAGLWGMTCAQTVIYFTRSQSDGKFLRAFIVMLWVMDTVHLLFCIQACWEVLISRFGHLHQFSAFPQGLMYQLFATCIVMLTTQWFFIWRIWRICRLSLKTWVFPGILIPVTIVELGACIYLLVKGLGKPASFFHEQTAKTTILIISITAAFVDIMTAIILGVMLWRSRTGLRQSDRMIFRLISASVGTGSCIVILRVFVIVAILGWSRYYLEFVAEISMATVYCNTVLALLNSRDYFRGSSVMIDAFSKPLEISVVHTVRIGSPPESAAQEGSPAETTTRIYEEDVQSMT